MLLSLLRRVLADHRRSILGWGLGLCGIVVLQMSAYPAIRGQIAAYAKMFEAYPPAIKAMLGAQGSLSSSTGYVEAESCGLVVPLVLTAIGITVGAGLAADLDRGRLEVLLSAPVPRGRIVLARALAMATALAATGLALFACLAVVSRAVGLNVAVADLGAASLAAVLHALVFGTIALAVACVTGRHGAAVAAGVTATLVAFLLNSLASFVTGLQPWEWLSPFHHLAVADALRGEVPVLSAAGLAAAAVLFVGGGVLGFARRDVAR